MVSTNFDFVPETVNHFTMRSLGTFCKALKIVWNQFAETTGIHGIKFIMDEQGNFISR